MATWTELEAQFEDELRKLAKELDESDAEEQAAEAELNAKLNAAPAEAQAKIQKRIAEMRAKNEAGRKALDDRITSQLKVWDQELDKMDAQMDATYDKAQADLAARQAVLRARRDEARSRLQASLTTQLNHLNAEIYELEARSASTDAHVRAQVNAQVRGMRKQSEAIQQELQLLVFTGRESWNAHKARVDRALADLRAGFEKAAAEFHCTDALTWKHANRGRSAPATRTRMNNRWLEVIHARHSVGQGPLQT